MADINPVGAEPKARAGDYIDEKPTVVGTENVDLSNNLQAK